MNELTASTLKKLEEEIDAEIPTWALRPGESSPHTLFCAIGHALTRWERVEVSLVEVLRAMQPDSQSCNKVIRNYSRRRDSQQRINFLEDEFQKLTSQCSFAAVSREKFAYALRTYVKWKIARNRLAHGVVIKAGPTMMEDIKNGMIVTYSLCPSEVDHHAWAIPWSTELGTDGKAYFKEGDSDHDYIFDGPVFNYLACDIERISRKFLRIDGLFRGITRRVASKNKSSEFLIENLELDPTDLST